MHSHIMFPSKSAMLLITSLLQCKSNKVESNSVTFPIDTALLSYDKLSFREKINQIKMFEFFGVTAVVLLILIIVYIFYSTIVKNRNFFSDRNIIFERSLPLLGTLHATILGKCPIGISTQNVYKKHLNRRFVGMYDMGGAPIY